MISELYIDTPIWELKTTGRISIKMLHFLHEMSVLSLKDLFIRYPNPASLVQLTGVERGMAMQLKYLYMEWQEKVVYRRCSHILPDNWDSIRDILQMEHSNILMDPNIDKDIQKAFPSYLHIHIKIMESDSQVLFEVNRQLDKRQNLSLRKLLHTYISRVAAYKEKCMEIQSAEYRQYAFAAKQTQPATEGFTYVEYAENFVMPATNQYLQHEYDKLVYSIRDKEIIREIRSVIRNYPQAVRLFNANGMKLEEVFGTTAYRKVYPYIYQLLYDFERIFRMNYQKVVIETGTPLKNEDFGSEESDERFIQEFKESYGYLPVFYLLRDLVRNSSQGHVRTAGKMLGLEDGKEYTKEQILAEAGISEERLGTELQRIADLNLQGKPQELSWEAYEKWFSQPFIHEGSAEFLEMRQKECLPYSFSVFANIVQLQENWEKVTVSGEILLVNSLHINIRNLEGILTRLREEADKVRTEDTVFPSGHFCQEEKDGPLNDHEKALIVYLGKRHCDLVASGQDCLLFRKSKTDAITLVYRILEYEDRPMDKREMFKYANEYLDYDERFHSEEQMMSILLQDQRISIKDDGKTLSLYEWGTSIQEEIHGVIQELLEEVGRPVGRSILMNKVMFRLPKVQANDILECLKESSDIEVMTGGLIGFK